MVGYKTFMVFLVMAQIGFGYGYEALWCLDMNWSDIG